MKVGQPQPRPAINSPSPRNSAERKGALILIDSFHSPDAHGFQVEGAARSLGPTGPVYHYNQLQNVDGRVTMPHVEAMRELQSTMSSEVLSPETARESLTSFLDSAISSNISLVTGLLKEVSSEGFQNSVVNLSQGFDPITYFKIVKSPLGGKDLSDQQKQIYFHNLNSAVSPQAADVSKFDNLLLGSIKTAINGSEKIESARNAWREQVRNFESNHNSVVVAAGNSGQELSAMTQAGFDIDGSEDLNVFAVPEVTTVAASATSEGGGIILPSPSSFGPEVDFIVSGFHGESFGSSFAAPKVANIMRAAHAFNPSATSDQIEDWAKTEVSAVGEIRGHEVGILREELASSLLQEPQ
ncbi:MAG: hypothetical protein KC800_03985 [Candidatus Eremiobacteraeota bacterium]|nr:hypothetical protein [Candidatus Eremiobacteraeota bacterium]